MKTIFKILLVSFFLLVFQFALFAQDSPPDPPPAGGQSGNSNVSGGNAPIGSGLTILLLLGAAYGSKKMLNWNSEEINNNKN